MATTYWVGNGQNIAQVVQLQVTAIVLGGTLTATINGKSITYTGTATDTITSAATNWMTALNNSSVTPPEFQEIAWTNPSAGIVLATARNPGTPFAGMTGGLTSSAGGGAGVIQSNITASSSRSSVKNPANWNRAGAAAVPQNGDDVIVQNSSVPLLWDLDFLNSVQFNSFTRWQNFTATIGLPENNPAGYVEYRPTYFQFSGPPAGTLQFIIGEGNQGNGPSRERYDTASQLVNWAVLASGSPVDAYAVRLLGHNAANTLSVIGTSVGVAMLPGEVATVNTASVEGGGTLALGPGVTFNGQLTVDSANAVVNCNPPTILAQNNSSVRVQNTLSVNYNSVQALNGSRLTWISPSTIASLVLKLSSILDKSGDTRAMTIINSTIDVDSCTINDPWNAITYTNATVCNNGSNAGPFIFGPGRTVKVT